MRLPDFWTRPRARRNIDLIGTYVMIALVAFALGHMVTSTFQERPQQPVEIVRGR